MSTGKSGNELGKAELLWDEYKYRHEHCWLNRYRLVAAAIALSVAPYLDDDLANQLSYLIVLPAVIAVVLIAVSIFRIKRELLILSAVKKKYQDVRRDVLGVQPVGGGTFNRHIYLFVSALLFMALANVAVSAWWVLKVLPLPQ